MSNEVKDQTTAVSGLVVPGLGGKDLQQRKKEAMKFLPAIGVLNSKNKNLKGADNKPRLDVAEGDFYDYKTDKSFGSEIQAVALTYRLRFRVYEKRGKESIFQESIYIQRKPDTPYVIEPAYIALAEKYKDAKYDITQSMDVLVYLIDHDEFRHFDCKGMLDEGATKFCDFSLPEGSTSYVPCKLETKYVAAGQREWYELVPTPMAGKTVEFPNLETAQAVIKMFIEVTKDSSAPPVTQSESSDGTPKKRTDRSV